MRQWRLSCDVESDDSFSEADVAQAVRDAFCAGLGLSAVSIDLEFIGQGPDDDADLHETLGVEERI